jgi:transposase
MKKENNKVKRYYLGVDWADREHQVYVGDHEGKKIMAMKVQETPEGLVEFGRWLDEGRAEGIEVWAAIEKPHGRIVDFLLDHGVVVYPVNPKAVDRARDRFRMSQSKSDGFDAYVLSEFLRTDHTHLRALQPNSEPAQELKMLSRDHQRVQRHNTRLLNQLKVTLKEYYPRPLEVFGDLESQIARDFLKAYPTPGALAQLNRRQWKRFVKQHPPLSEARSAELWEKLSQPQLAMPEHVVRAKARLVKVLLDQLEASIQAVKAFTEEVERFFASMPAAKLVQALPGGKSGTIMPAIWAELGDARGRWESFRHLQAEGGTVPVTKESGKSRRVEFRFACNKHLRRAVYLFAFITLNRSEWANAYYRDQRAKGHGHHRALRALGAKWLKIIFVMWRDHKPYDEKFHLANMALQKIRQAA